MVRQLHRVDTPILSNRSDTQLLRIMCSPTNMRRQGPTLVFVICSLRGDSIRATNDVENSISSSAMSPCFVSKHLEKGSVVYIRKPLEVPQW